MMQILLVRPETMSWDALYVLRLISNFVTEAYTLLSACYAESSLSRAKLQVEMTSLPRPCLDLRIVHAPKLFHSSVVILLSPSSFGFDELRRQVTMSCFWIYRHLHEPFVALELRRGAHKGAC